MMLLDALRRLVRGRADHRAVFEAIHRSQAWGDGESASGPGSTRERAASFVPDLLDLIRDLEVRVLVDAPCGDFNWMAPVADAVERYVGVDVVRALIGVNAERHAGSNRVFQVADLTRDVLPRGDLVLCRDCLVHFSLADIRRAIGRLRASGAEYLLTTTFVGDRRNQDIRTGSWRPLNLERPPFCFPPPLRLVHEHCLHTEGIYRDKRLGLWRLAELPVPHGG